MRLIKQGNCLIFVFSNTNNLLKGTEINNTNQIMNIATKKTQCHVDLGHFHYVRLIIRA